MDAGAPHGLIAAGIGVYNTTGRLEKGYRAYGAELDGDYDVVEAGMAWGTVKEPDFIGKAGPRRRSARPPPRPRCMCTLTVDDHALGRWRQPLHAPPTCRSSPATAQPLTDARGRTSYVTSAGSAPSLGPIF